MLSKKNTNYSKAPIKTMRYDLLFFPRLTVEEAKKKREELFSSFGVSSLSFPSATVTCEEREGKRAYFHHGHQSNMVPCTSRQVILLLRTGGTVNKGFSASGNSSSGNHRPYFPPARGTTMSEDGSIFN